MKNLEIGQDAILITGPTASGKSALAVALAKQHNGVVVNADSMQVYDTLHVLTARPFEADMQGVAHHLYGHVPASQHYSTGEWFRDAATVLEGIHREGKVPVFVGGTGLYFKALTGGLSDMPAVPSAIREDVRGRLLAQGAEALHAVLVQKDPETAAILRSGDGQRIARALEIYEATGQSIRIFQERQGPVAIDPGRAMKIVVLPERALLRSADRPAVCRNAGERRGGGGGGADGVGPEAGNARDESHRRAADCRDVIRWDEQGRGDRNVFGGDPAICQAADDLVSQSARR